MQDGKLSVSANVNSNINSNINSNTKLNTALNNSPKKPILEIQNISVLYNAKPVIEDFSLMLKEGERIVIEGPNGSGKTTLLKAILGNVKLSKGKIQISNNTRTAYCKQGFTETKAPISVYEVVAMGLYKQSRNDEARVVRAMKETGVNHLVDRRFGELSGGEKQRVSLARCFCQDANLLLMDEPSSFLDVEFREEFVQLMHSLPVYMAVIVVTHDAQLTQALGWPIVKLDKTIVNLSESPVKQGKPSMADSLAVLKEEAPCRE